MVRSLLLFILFFIQNKCRLYIYIYKGILYALLIIPTSLGDLFSNPIFNYRKIDGAHGV